ncbi:unnamed protein product [Prunus brigantina]
MLVFLLPLKAYATSPIFKLYRFMSATNWRCYRTCAISIVFSNCLLITVKV